MTVIIGQTDRPIEKIEFEALGLGEYVTALVEFVINCQTPITISSQGDWGTGKTSMMNLIKENLVNKHKAIFPVWFNTWQFSQFNMQNYLPISLLTYLIENLDSKSTHVAKIFGKIGRGLAKVATTFLVEKTMGETNAEALCGNDGAIDIAKEVINLKKELELLVHEKIQREARERLVFFVDDLDRLPPEKAVELLEVIKLFLDIDKCVFILAVDYNVVVRGVKAKYGEGFDEAKGRSFFDKIIQLPFNLPVSQYKADKYFSEMLKSGGVVYSEDDLPLLMRVSNLSIGFNPRGMKRLFNSFQLLKMVAQTKKILDEDKIATSKEKHRILFCILCMQTGFEKLYRFFQKNMNQLSDELFRKFRNMTGNEDPFSEEEKKELDLADSHAERRLSDFVSALYEATQLDSDISENQSENLSQNEVINLKTLLSFSSIIGSDVEGRSDSSNNLKYLISANEISKESNSQYESKLNELGIRFNCEASNSEFWVFSDISIGTFASRFVGNFCVNGSAFYFDDVFPPQVPYVCGGKNTVGRWFENKMKAEFPNMEINNRRTYGYLVLSRLPNEEDAKAADAQLITKFKTYFYRVLDQFLPKLIQFKKDKIGIISQINRFIARIFASLKSLFPAGEGWSIEDKTGSLGILSAISVFHQDWKNGIKLEISTHSPNFSDLFFWVRRKGWNVKYNPVWEERVCKEFDTQLGQGGWSEPWTIRAKKMKTARYPITGDFLDDSFSFAFDSEEKIVNAINEIVDFFQKAKQHLKPLIDHIPAV